MNVTTAIYLLKDLEQSLDDYCELNDEGKTAFRMAITALEVFGNSEQLPSAQPEKRTEERTETHACDCISRLAAIEKFEPWLKVDGYSEGELNMLKAVLYELQFMPSAHPEIIHCRECKHWKTDHPTANGYHCCHRIHNAFPMRGDDYCSRAERRGK